MTIGDDVIRLMPQAREGGDGPVRWFQVGSVKLALMSLATLGVYELYWFYKQWTRVNESGSRPQVQPFWRALLTLFFCYSLFTEIEQSAVEADLTRRHATGMAAVAYIALSLTTWLPDGWWALCFLSVIPLIVVQRLINTIQAATDSALRPNTKLSVWNWLVIVPAALFWALVLVGTIIPTPQEDPASQAHLSSLATELGQGLPRALNSDTTVTAVSGLTGALVYHLRLVNREAGDIEARRQASSVTGSFARWECTEARLRRYLDAGVTIRHVFEDRSGRWIVTLDVSRDDCGS